MSAGPREPEDCEVGQDGCTCRWSSINSASIDPPHPTLDPWCPVHGGRDPDEEYERRRDDCAEPFWASWEEW